MQFVCVCVCVGQRGNNAQKSAEGTQRMESPSSWENRGTGMNLDTGCELDVQSWKLDLSGHRSGELSCPNYLDCGEYKVDHGW